VTAVWGTPNKEQLTILNDIHNYACQNLKLASDQKKTHFDKLAICVGYHDSDKVWPA
jgi:hypothetical protein